jgi:hypothetical protein
VPEKHNFGLKPSPRLEQRHQDGRQQFQVGDHRAAHYLTRPQDPARIRFSTGTPDLDATQLDGAVHEGRPVVTELSANASAMTYWVSEADGGHVVTTVDTVIRQDGERQQVLRIRRLGEQIEIARIPGSA